MPATSRVTVLSSGITRETIYTNLKTALNLAGYTTLVDESTDTANTRSLVHSVQLSPTTHGTIFLENRLTSTRILSSRIFTTYNTTTKTAGAIATPFNSSVQFNITARITFTSINHPELRLVVIEQGVGTIATIIGIARPAVKPTWWDENSYPYAFIAQSNTINNFLAFPAANNPYANTNPYPLLYISQLAQKTPVVAQADAIAGIAAILPPVAQGWSGIFSNEVALCSASGLKRTDMIGEFLLLSGGVSALAIRSNVPF